MSAKVTRKLSTSGKYSKALNLPREFLKLLGWRQNQNLSVELDKTKKSLIVKDAKR
jgi:antitoxin component of MazEF toxin-antitoxin module